MAITHHLAYGLRIASDLALPELPSASAAAGPSDLRVSFGPVPNEPLVPTGHAPSPGLQRVVLSPDDVRYLGDPVGRFAVRGGAEIIIDRAPGVSDEALRPYLLSRLLGVALIQRGHLVLHGSVVAREGRALGLLGASGAGKSTLAAALAARGWAVLADEHVVLDPATADAPRVLAACGSLKLDATAARATGLLAAGTTNAAADTERYYQHDATPAAPATASVPLAGLCLLQRGADQSCARLSPRAAVLACIAHTYGAPLLDALGCHADHFARCTALVAQREVHALTRSDDLARLPELAERVARLFAATRHVDAARVDTAVGAPRPLC